MRPVLLHGVVPAGTPWPPDAPDHLRCTAGGLLALASAVGDRMLDDRDGAATIAAGLAHDALLSAHARVGPVLPVRFGTLFSGEAAVRARLAADADDLARALSRLGRASEYGLSFLSGAPPEPVAPAPSGDTGRGFLRQRGAARQARQERTAQLGAFLDTVTARLADHAAEVRPTGRTGPGRVADLAALVRPEKAPGFLRLAEGLAAEAARHGLRLRLGGPWPAYSFCAEAGHG